jgi:hypothetical protein
MYWATPFPNDQSSGWFFTKFDHHVLGTHFRPLVQQLDDTGIERLFLGRVPARRQGYLHEYDLVAARDIQVIRAVDEMVRIVYPAQGRQGP